jgi:hypothetical protein
MYSILIQHNGMYHFKIGNEELEAKNAAKIIEHRKM